MEFVFCNSQNMFMAAMHKKNSVIKIFSSLLPNLIESICATFANLALNEP